MVAGMVAGVRELGEGRKHDAALAKTGERVFVDVAIDHFLFKTQSLHRFAPVVASLR